MQLDSHVQQIQQELAAAAARGDEQAAELARSMGEALAATRPPVDDRNSG